MNKNFILILIFLFFGSISLIAQAPKVSHIYPNVGVNEQSIVSYVYGDSFTVDTVYSVKLIRSGYPEIEADFIGIISESYLTCSFDLTGDSTGLYDLVLTNASGSDTLPGCFNVYTRSVYPYRWVKSIVDSTEALGFSDIAIGDADNDGENEVYTGYELTQFKWDGNNWLRDTIGPGIAAYSIAIGDCDNDCENEIYAADVGGGIFRLKWNGSNWFWTSVGNGGSVPVISIGDGYGDGEAEIYSASQSGYIYQFKWNGVNWDRTIVADGITSYMPAIYVGDGNNNGQMEVYIAMWGASYGVIRGYSWYGTYWDWFPNALPCTGNPWGLTIGDGDNDGEREVFVSDNEGLCYMFKWSGSLPWDMVNIGSGADYINNVAVGDGNGDGGMEVYGACNDDNVYQFRLNGSDWEKMLVGSGDGDFLDVAVGDGDNDGEMEVYAINGDTSLYQFKVVPGPDIFLSDSIHDFGSVHIGDSLDWDYLGIKNTGITELLIDSLIVDTINFSLVGYECPDTIMPGDSVLLTVRFKPSIVDSIIRELLIYSNDADEPVKIVILIGSSLESTPPEPFNLIRPYDSVFIELIRPLFIWEASFDSSGVEGYEVYIKDTLRADISDTTWTSDYDLMEGLNKWYVVAYDSLGNRRQSEQIFSLFIDISGPFIDSTTIWSDTSFSGDFPIYSKLTDVVPIDTVLLIFKRIEDPLWVIFEMADSGDGWYYAEITQAYINNDTIKYYIYSRDSLNNESTDPPGAPASYYYFIANFSGVQEKQGKPKVFSLGVNSIGRNTTVFKVSLPDRTDVILNIYDILGRIVSSPASGSYSAGYYSIPFKPEKSGIYFYLFKSAYGERRGKIVVF
jgi:hypothetical protein